MGMPAHSHQHTDMTSAHMNPVLADRSTTAPKRLHVMLLGSYPALGKCHYWQTTADATELKVHDYVTA